MPQVKNFGLRTRKDDAGLTKIEFGLVAALISVVLVAGVTFVGAQFNQSFDDVQVGTNITPAELK